MATSQIQIAPSLLAADFSRLGEDIQQAEAAGADQLHLDVMDGRFVPNISFGPMIVKVARRLSNLPLDVHLMIVEPEKQLKTFAEAGANTITVHLEACPNLHRTLQEIRALGLEAGVALNPHSPALLISEVLPLLDRVLVMTVNPGAGGQNFLYEMVGKIKTLRRMITQEKRPIRLAVDGGIDPTTAPLAIQAGADYLVAGTAVFGAKGGVRSGMAALQASTKGANAL